ncbi:MAG: ferric reductase-like transmembrane domain-containing protein [Desulfopila sp.]|jgi:predicted ferric reductase|nr:ferric reductase-like transmembrane domain-containing protein [Desulfopila sp.]
METVQFYTPRQRAVLQLLLLLSLLLLAGAAATIPFLWESTSLWYKFGWDRTLLQTGKIAGLAAAVLLFLQLTLASRTMLLDRVFGLDRVYYSHQINGFVIIAAVLLHVLLVIVPEGISNLPIGWKFWPEMLGAAIFFTLVPFVFLASVHKKLLSYHIWRRMHRFMGYLFLPALFIHILYVSDSFNQNVPRYSLFVFTGVILGIVAGNKYRVIRQSLQKMEIRSLQPLSDAIVQLETTRPSTFSYAPGQFAFLTLWSAKGRAEAHPFTIASSPTNDDSLHFMIKKCGDWTSGITDTPFQYATLEGPYGLFSYKANRTTDDIVFIAAGIGITPMLSMLRMIAMEHDQPRTTLLWSLRRKKEMFLQQELDNLADKISSFHLHLVYSREKNGGRINREMLRNHFDSIAKTGHYYICGPPGMIQETRRNLRDLGVPRKNIFQEKFSL